MKSKNKKRLLFIIGGLGTVIFTIALPICQTYDWISLPSFDLQIGLLISFIIWLLLVFVKLFDVEESNENKHDQFESKLNKYTTDLEKTNNNTLDVKANIESLALKEFDKLLPITIYISNFNDFLIYFPLYVAKEFKFFEQEDLVPDIKSQGNDDKAFLAMKDNGFQFAITDPAMTFLFRDKIADGRIIAPLINKAALWGVSKKDLYMLTKNHIKILSYPEPSTGFMLVNKWLADNEITNYSINDGINTSTTSNYEFFEEILKKEVADCFDLICLTEPEISYFKRLGFNEVIDFHNDLYNDYYFNFTAILTRQKYIDNNPEVIKRFLKAMRLAYNFIYSVKRDVNNKYWYEILRSVENNILKSYPSILDISRDALHAILDNLLEKEYFSKTIVYYPEQRDGLYKSYKLHKPNDEDMTANITDFTVDANTHFHLTI
jgi:hypothetical protein